MTEAYFAGFGPTRKFEVKSDHYRLLLEQLDRIDSGWEGQGDLGSQENLGSQGDPSLEDSSDSHGPNGNSLSKALIDSLSGSQDP